MSTNITLKRSSVQGKVPVVGDLALGEIALNTYDGKLFIKKNVDGTESIVDVTANTNLTLTSNSSTVSVNSDRGTDVTILAANDTTAGVLTADAQTIGGAKAFTSVTTISANSASAALTVTQTGAGNAFVVEDSASPDSTPFVVNSVGEVGIGRQPTSGVSLDIGATSAQLRMTSTTTAIDLRIHAFNAANAAYVGTQSNHPLSLMTNSTERIWIGANGNVGIGNTTPVDKLSVNGTSYFGANVTILSALTANGSVGTAGQVLTSNATGIYWSTVGFGANLSLTSNSSTVSVNSDSGTDATILAANATTAGVLTADAQTIAGVKTFTSNVGIGNTAPAQTLTVDGTIGGTIIATQAEAETGTDNTKLMTPLRVEQALAFSALAGANLVAPSVSPYIPSAGMKGCLVIVTGGGGGGGGADAADTAAGSGGSGGGAGGTAIRYYTKTEIGANAAFSIGAGGSAGSGTNGTNGSAGGTTTFTPVGGGTSLSAGGGAAGIGGGVADPGSQSAGGVGALPTGGLFNLTGGDGSGGAGDDVAEISFGGNGGSSFWGGSGRGGVIQGSSVAAGQSGAVGGGGGGGAVIDSTTGAAGGAGGPGVIFILEFI